MTTPAHRPIPATGRRQRATEHAAKPPGEPEVAARTLVGSQEPVQAVLVHPPTARVGRVRADPAATFQGGTDVRLFPSLADTADPSQLPPADTASGSLGGPAARLAAKQAVFGVFFTWAPGGTLAERTRRGHALLAGLDPTEAEGQRQRLAACINIAQAVGGPPPEMVRPQPAEVVDVVAIFFRPAPGLPSLLARRRQARAILARLRGRPYEQALRLYHAIGVLTDPDTRPQRRSPRREETR
jgi:hypothetical protein